MRKKGTALFTVLIPPFGLIFTCAKETEVTPVKNKAVKKAANLELQFI
jgi:hypothetical protein